jgi:hypothetical protein
MGHAFEVGQRDDLPLLLFQLLQAGVQPPTFIGLLQTFQG